MSSPGLTVIHSNVPNLEAKCIRCHQGLKDITMTLKDENDEPAPFLIAYYCINTMCTAFGLLTVAHLP